MIRDITELNYSGILTSKWTGEYTDKDGNKATNYNIKFEFLGGFQNFRVSKDIYEKLEENKFYILPVGTKAYKMKDGNLFVNFFIKSKSGTIYEVSEDNELITLS